jgi:hypothetical protein
MESPRKAKGHQRNPTFSRLRRATPTQTGWLGSIPGDALLGSERQRQEGINLAAVEHHDAFREA